MHVHANRVTITCFFASCVASFKFYALLSLPPEVIPLGLVDVILRCNHKTLHHAIILEVVTEKLSILHMLV
jgi:hypothetical protein